MDAGGRRVAEDPRGCARGSRRTASAGSGRMPRLADLGSRRRTPTLDSTGGIRLLRSPARAQRVLDARRGGAGQAADRRGLEAGHAGDRRHRPRQHVRRLRLLQDRDRHGHQADHRHGGLRHPRHAPRRQGPRALGKPRPERRRRLGLRRLHAHDPARGEQRGHAQPVPDVVVRLARGLLLQAAPRPRAAADLREGRHRDDRLRRRRGADPAPPRPVRRGEGGRRGVPRHLRQGQLLRRGHGSRHRHRAPHDERPDAAREGARPPARRHERPALHAPARRQEPRGPALRAVGLDAR